MNNGNDFVSILFCVPTFPLFRITLNTVGLTAQIDTSSADSRFDTCFFFSLGLLRIPFTLDTVIENGKPFQKTTTEPTELGVELCAGCVEDGFHLVYRDRL